MKQRNNRTGGFTIIEVVLVLAVAGLIFLVVFAAVPRLQASRRDNQRKRDAEFMWALILEYESNTGNLPAIWDLRLAIGSNDVNPFYSYIGPEGFSDPSGGTYTNVTPTTVSAPGTFSYHTGMGCVPGDTILSAASPLRGSILMGLERGVYCVGGR